eukprot:EG_transcript_19433
MILKEPLFGMQETGVGLLEPDYISGLCGDGSGTAGSAGARGAPRQLCVQPTKLARGEETSEFDIPRSPKGSELKDVRISFGCPPANGHMQTVAILVAPRSQEDSLEREDTSDSEKTGSPPLLSALSPSPGRFNMVASLPPEHQRPLVPDAKPPKADAAPNAKRLEPLLPPADPGLLAQEEMCPHSPSPMRGHGRSRSIQPLSLGPGPGFTEEEPATSPLLPCGEPRDKIKIQRPIKLIALPTKLEPSTPSSPTWGPSRDFGLPDPGTAIPAFVPGDPGGGAKGPLGSPGVNSFYRSPLSPCRGSDIRATDFANVSPGLG